MDKDINKSDEDLVTLSIARSEYFSVLIHRYERRLWRYISRLCSCSDQDIEDLLQEIFIKTYRNLNDFDSGLKFSSWIYRITHNEVISHYRKLKARPQSTDFDLGLLPDNSINEFTVLLDKKLDKPRILKILRTMDLKYKEVLVLRFFEEKDYNEISDILKKPSGTVATLLNRAKRQFRDKAKKLNIDF